MFLFKNKVASVENEVKVEVKLDYTRPIDLVVMANSLISLNNLAVEYISKEHGVKDTKLFLSGVKEGSAVYELVFLFAASSLPFVSYASSVIQIIEFIKSYITLEEKPIEEIKNNRHYNNLKNIKNVENIIAPIEDDNSNSSLTLSLNGNNNNVQIFQITAEDKKRAGNNIELVKKIIDVPLENSNIFSEVLIKLYKVMNTTKEVQDSAYCEDIVPNKAMPTIFENETDKKEILGTSINNLFLVDIEVFRSDSKIKMYKVLKLHNILPDVDNEAN